MGHNSRHAPLPAAEAAAAPDTVPAPPLKSIAVLPILDMSAQKDQEYFSDGLSGELIGLLTKAPELRERLDGEAPAEVEAIKDAYAAGSWEGFLRHRVTAMEAQPQPVPEEVASCYARLGAVDQALPWLHKAYANLNAHLTLLKVDPRHDNLRGDARFTELLQRVGLGGT